MKEKWKRWLLRRSGPLEASFIMLLHMYKGINGCGTCSVFHLGDMCRNLMSITQVLWAMFESCYKCPKYPVVISTQPPNKKV